MVPYVIGVLVLVLVLYLAVVIFSPLIHEPNESLLKPSTDLSQLAASPLSPRDVGAMKGASPLRATTSCVRRDVRFESEGEEVAGYLYMPASAAGPVPCVVLNNGLGGTKEHVVEQYALRFSEAGLAALTYDYRHFGESSGQPRQLLSLDKQVEDCRAAIRFVRSLPDIAANRVAVWGTSSAGGYGLVVAATDHSIACVCSQCGSLDHEADSRMIFKREGLGFFLKLFVHAQRDKGRSRFGLSPHCIAVVGRPGAAALLTAPGAVDGYAGLTGLGFVNKICARALVTRHDRMACDVVAQVRCPVLIQVCDKDVMISVPGSLAMAERMGGLAEVKQYPIGHFDIYHGEHFERAVADQMGFLKRCLAF